MASEAADVTSVARVKVETDGSEQLKALADSFAALAKSAAAASKEVKAVSPGGAAKPQPAKPDAGQKLQEQTVNTINRIFEPIGRVIGAAIRLPFDALRAAATAAGPVIASITEMFTSLFTGLARWLASLGPAAVVAVPAMAALGLAASKFVIAAGQIAIGFKLLGSSFEWAKQWAEGALKIQALTTRLRPDTIGPDFDRAQAGLSKRVSGLAILVGQEQAESMTKAWAKKMEDLRAGKLGKEETATLEQLGITEQKLDKLEEMLGRPPDVTDFLAVFIKARDRLQAELAKAPEGSEQAEKIRDNLRKLFKAVGDSLGEEGQAAFANFTEAQHKRAEQLAREARAIVPPNATKEAQEFSISMKGLMLMFDSIKQAIGANVTPQIREFFDTLQTKLKDTKDGGQGLARLLVELGSAFASHAWQVVKRLVDEFLPSAESIRSLIEKFRDPKAVDESVKSIKDMIESVKGVGRAFAWLFGQFDTFINKDIPEFLRSIEAFKQGWSSFFEWLKGLIDWLLEKAGLKKPEEEQGPPAPRRDVNPGRAAVRELRRRSEPEPESEPPAQPPPAKPRATTPERQAPDQPPPRVITPPPPAKPRVITPPPPRPQGEGDVGERIRGGFSDVERQPIPNPRLQERLIRKGNEFFQKRERDAIESVPGASELLRRGQQILRERNIPGPGSSLLGVPGFDAGDLGSSFGDAAALALMGGLYGYTIPIGVPSNSRGVAPRSAPKETGGDTASEG